MERDIFIKERLYDEINDIATISRNEQMMLFGGKTVGNTVVIDENSFFHFKGNDIVNNTKGSIEVPLRVIEEQMVKNRQMGNDTFFMTHSHYCSFKPVEFMYGDLSDGDEELSSKLRNLCNKYGLDYYDGITTGKRVYFWASYDDGRFPVLLDCRTEYEPIKYNRLTQKSEDLEHQQKLQK